jgi:hypothetical protein
VKPQRKQSTPESLVIDDYFALRPEGRKMVRGEAVRAIVDYDLFDTNINGHVGVYLKTDPNSGKHLVCFREFGEWAELKDEWLERVDPGSVPKKNEKFVNRIKELAITLET